MLKIQTLPMSLLEMNTGQIPGLPKNPRQWTAIDVDRLAKSIKETPELLDARPLIVVEHSNRFVVLGGNLRLAALKKLGWDEAPCYLLPADAPVDKLKEIVIKDNGSFGQWDYDLLANEWDDLDLSGWGAGVPEDWGKVREPQAPVPGVAPGAPAGNIDIDGLFDQNAQAPTKEHPVVISVCIPQALADKQEDIRAALLVTLEDFPGVILK